VYDVAPFPRRISVEVTNHCDQACTLCPRGGLTRPLGFIEAAVFDRVAAECAEHGTVLWLHFLGEPLLHPEILALIRAAKRRGVVQVGLSTNATRLDAAMIDGLLASGLDRLECSMDADDRRGYAAMRGRDHFERVDANVRALLARKRELDRDVPVTSIQYMRTPQVESRLREIVQRWRPWLGPRDFVMTIVPAAFGGAIGEAGAALARAEVAERSPCHWLFSSLMVLQDGTVTMCGADWDAEAPLGNVRDTSLSAIWHGTEVGRRRRAHLDSRFSDVARCGSCVDWRLADGSGYVNACAEVDQTRAPDRER